MAGAGAISGATGIGLLRERSLHAAIKAWYRRPGDLEEAELEGYRIDLVRDGTLIEIQTRSFGHLKRKLAELLPGHPVRLVHPVAVETWIAWLPGGGRSPGRRKSPRRGHPLELFEELVALAGLASHPNFSLELLLARVEEVRRDDGRGARRRKGASLCDRRLLGVTRRIPFASPSDYLAFLPPGWRGPSTNRDLAARLSQPVHLVAKLTYSLERMGVLEKAGKSGNAILYRRASGAGMAAAIRP